MSFFMKKEKDGSKHPVPLMPPVHPALLNHISKRHESPDSRLRNAKVIGSVLLKKSKKFANDVHEKRKQNDIAKKERIKAFDDYVDEILESDMPPKSKFRRLQRFAHDNRNKLTSRQIMQINQELQELDLHHSITPDPVEQPTKVQHDKNPNPVTFASLEDEHDNITASVDKNTPQSEIDKKADRLNEIEHHMEKLQPTKDEQSLNDLAHEYQQSKSKSKLSDITQGEINLEKSKHG